MEFIEHIIEIAEGISFHTFLFQMAQKMGHPTSVHYCSTVTLLFNQF